jgi:hypothetical protein
MACAAGTVPNAGVQAPVIDAILIADLDAPHKQRHTITRIFVRLCGEHGMTDVSYRVVRSYVARRLPEIRTEHGRGDARAFVPQTHLPGREAEVDFGEISVRVRGEPVTCHLFVLRMSYSGKAVHRVSATPMGGRGHVSADGDASTAIGGVAQLSSNRLGGISSHRRRSHYPSATSGFVLRHVNWIHRPGLASAAHTPRTPIADSYLPTVMTASRL